MAGQAPPPPEGAADPSMEDILASIRRILNEDEAAPAVDAPPAAEPHAGHDIHHDPSPAPAAEAEDVLMLDPATMIPDAVQPPPPPVVEPPPPVPVAAPAPAAVTAAAVPAAPSLIAAETETAAVASVGLLLRTLTAERTTQVHRNGPTIEDLVREEMRPLLAAWLDAHLPPMVERLVRAEIERVTGRAAV